MRRYLEKKATEAEKKATTDESETSHSDVRPCDILSENKIIEAVKKPSAQALGRSTSFNPDESIRSKAEITKKGFFSKFRVSKSVKGDSKTTPLRLESFHENETERENDPCQVERPAFCSLMHGASSAKKIEPRAVAIPYTRLKKDRFYDWPPDPTVSRATAIDVFPETMDEIDSLTASVPDIPIPDQDDENPTTLRRRHVPEKGIPTSVSFEVS